jgi:hypothetical protein
MFDKTEEGCVIPEYKLWYNSKSGAVTAERLKYSTGW